MGGDRLPDLRADLVRGDDALHAVPGLDAGPAGPVLRIRRGGSPVPVERGGLVRAVRRVVRRRLAPPLRLRLRLRLRDVSRQDVRLVGDRRFGARHGHFGRERLPDRGSHPPFPGSLSVIAAPVSVI